jgi:hypothetical protein
MNANNNSYNCNKNVNHEMYVHVIGAQIFSVGLETNETRVWTGL